MLSAVVLMLVPASVVISFLIVMPYHLRKGTQPAIIASCQRDCLSLDTVIQESYRRSKTHHPWSLGGKQIAGLTANGRENKGIRHRRAHESEPTVTGGMLEGEADALESSGDLRWVTRREPIWVAEFQWKAPSEWTVNKVRRRADRNGAVNKGNEDLSAPIQSAAGGDDQPRRQERRTKGWGQTHPYMTFTQWPRPDSIVDSLTGP